MWSWPLLKARASSWLSNCHSNHQWEAVLKASPLLQALVKQWTSLSVDNFECRQADKRVNLRSLPRRWPPDCMRSGAKSGKFPFCSWVFINPCELGDNKHICSFFRSAFQSLGGNGSGEPEPRNGLSTIVHGIAQLVYFIRTARISFRPGCPQDLQRKTILHIIRFNCIVRRACGTCPQVLSNFKKQWWEDWTCGMYLTTIRWIWILKLIGRWTVLTPVCLRVRARASGYCRAPGLEPRLLKTRAEGQLWYDKPRHLIVLIMVKFLSKM